MIESIKSLLEGVTLFLDQIYNIDSVEIKEALINNAIYKRMGDSE